MYFRVLFWEQNKIAIMSERNAKLIIIAGAKQGTQVPLAKKALLLGRGTNCDIPLFDKYASREHCWIEPRGDQWWLRDLGSKNGTLLDSKRVEHEHRLGDGEVIMIGLTHIRFSDPAETKTYEAAEPLEPERLMVNLLGREVKVDGKVISPPLSPKQWALLSTLWAHRGEALSKDAIANAVWPEADGAIYDYQIDKLVSRLRARLGDAGDKLVETVWGFGYKLK
ncbi:MAG: FHA domain-containing protein [Ardenticatenaceae bacterium]